MSLLLDSPAVQKVADTDNELDSLIFARDLGIVTDLKLDLMVIVSILLYIAVEIGSTCV